MYAKARVEPNEESVLDAIAAAREGGFDGFVGVGGGSSIDTAKIAALFATHGGELLDYVNRPIGRGAGTARPAAPRRRRPDHRRHRQRGDVGRDHRLPPTRREDRDLAPLPPPAASGSSIPLLTRDLPSAVTASCGLDVICHAAESYTARPFDSREKSTPDERPPYQGSNPISDLWSARALETGGRYLRRAVADGADLEARSAMMLAATIGRHRLRQRRRPHPARLRLPDRVAEARMDAGRLPGRAPIRPARVLGHRDGPGRVPLHRACRARPAPRGCPAARRRRTSPTTFAQLVRDVGAPATLRELGYTEEDVPALAEGASKQQRLLVVSPREARCDDLAEILRAVAVTPDQRQTPLADAVAAFLADPSITPFSTPGHKRSPELATALLRLDLPLSAGADDLHLGPTCSGRPSASRPSSGAPISASSA